MSIYLKLSVLAVSTALLAVVLRKSNPDFAMLASLCGCCGAALLAVELAKPVIEFGKNLFAATKMDNTLLSPLLKTVGISLLTQLSGAVCADAGESALAKIVELGGAVLCLCVAIPLMQDVLALVTDLVGG